MSDQVTDQYQASRRDLTTDSPAAGDDSRYGSYDEVLNTLRRMISEIIGEDYLMDIPITAETSFSDDLEMESIEFVALAERLTDHYGDAVDFVTWMAGMELEEIMALTTGQLVDFIVACINR